jgi:hypothetical protein
MFIYKHLEQLLRGTVLPITLYPTVPANVLISPDSLSAPLPSPSLFNIYCCQALYWRQLMMTA